MIKIFGLEDLPEAYPGLVGCLDAILEFPDCETVVFSLAAQYSLRRRSVVVL